MTLLERRVFFADHIAVRVHIEAITGGGGDQDVEVAFAARRQVRALDEDEKGVVAVVGEAVHIVLGEFVERVA